MFFEHFRFLPTFIAQLMNTEDLRGIEEDILIKQRHRMSLERNVSVGARPKEPILLPIWPFKTWR